MPEENEVIPFIVNEAKAAGVPPELALAIVKEESNFNQKAHNKETDARGFFQLRAAAAEDMGVNRNDPKDNIRGGIGYYKRQYDKYQDPVLALAAYNWGPGNVDKIQDFSKFPKATQDYITDINKSVPGFKLLVLETEEKLFPQFLKTDTRIDAAPPSIDINPFISEEISTQFKRPGRALRGFFMGVEDLMAKMIMPNRKTDFSDILLPINRAIESARSQGQEIDGKQAVRSAFGDKAAAFDIKLGNFMEYAWPPFKAMRPDEETGFIGTVYESMTDPVFWSQFLGIGGATKITTKSLSARGLRGGPGFSEEQVAGLLGTRERLKNASAGLEEAPILGRPAPQGSITLQTIGRKIEQAGKTIKARGTAAMQKRDKLVIKAGDPRIDMTDVLEPIKQDLQKNGVSFKIGFKGKTQRVILEFGKDAPFGKAAARKEMVSQVEDLINNPKQNLSALILKRKKINENISVQTESTVFGTKPADNSSRILISLNRKIGEAVGKVSPEIRTMDDVFHKSAEMTSNARFLKLNAKNIENSLNSIFGPNKKVQQRFLKALSDETGADFLPDLLAYTAARGKTSWFPLSGAGGGGVGGQLGRGGLAVGAAVTAAAGVGGAIASFLPGDMSLPQKVGLGATVGSAVLFSLLSPKVMGGLYPTYTRMAPSTRLFVKRAVSKTVIAVHFAENEDFRKAIMATAEEYGNITRKK